MVKRKHKTMASAVKEFHTLNDNRYKIWKVKNARIWKYWIGTTEEWWNK